MCFINRIFPLCAFATLIAPAFLSTSCDSAARREKASCDSMVQVAKQMIADGDFIQAFEVMDSVDKRFPSLLDQRREVTLMRSQAMEAYSQQQLILTDSIIATLETALADLSPMMEHVEGDDIAGYYVAKTVHNPNFLSSTGIQGRVDDEDLSFYLVAVNSQKPIGITQLCFHRPIGDMLTPAINPASERSGDSNAGGIDLASFLPDEMNVVVDAMEADPSSFASVTLIGKNKGVVQVKLTKEQVQAIVDTWKFSDCISRLQRARWLHDKYQNQLIVARDHTVNLE